MPSPPKQRKPIDPATIPSRIKLWLLENPGHHSANAIAAGIGVENKADKANGVTRPPVTNELSRMVRRGALVSTRPAGAPAKGPGSVYSLPKRG